MRKIKDLLGLHPQLLQEGLYGLEIEVEGKKLPSALNPTFWRVEKDDSLKTEEAWEYVTPKPFSLKGIKDALEYLQLVYQMNGSLVDESVRAGVHVHVNVQDWNFKQMMTFIFAYWTIEDPLLAYCGENRSGNLFTLRIRDGELPPYLLLKAINERNLEILSNDIIRYSSLNLCALGKYGSLEFRGMRGTGNLKSIYEWVEIINDLRNSSINFDDPVQIASFLSGDGELALFEALLPNTHHLFNHIKNKEQMIRDSIRRVQMLAFGVDWTSFGKENFNPFKKELW